MHSAEAAPITAADRGGDRQNLCEEERREALDSPAHILEGAKSPRWGKGKLLRCRCGHCFQMLQLLGGVQWKMLTVISLPGLLRNRSRG